MTTPTENTTLDQFGAVNIDGVAQMLGCSVARARKLVVTLPAFPRPARLGTQLIWHRTNVVAWLSVNKVPGPRTGRRYGGLA